MGALAISCPWLPQDDILLKNSIQAGASLESLARGAVEFSRKFSIKELQDRWWSLLYDPAVSIEACARMAELEQSAGPSKSKKVDVSKDCNVAAEKRKHESIRNCYYAMRKRVCHGPPLYQGDLSYLMDNSFINGVGEDMVEDPLANDFGLEDCNFEDLCNVSASVLDGGLYIGQQNMLEDPMDQNTVINDQGAHNIVEAKPVCHSENVRFSDCGTSYEHLGYSSTLDEMAAWDTVENLLLPDDVGITGNNVQPVGQFDITDRNNDAGEGIREDDNIHLAAALTNDMSYDDFKTSPVCPDDYFADITDFKFTTEDEMHINNEGNKETDDTCQDGLETLLLNTLDYVADDEVCNMPVINEQAAVVPDTRSGIIPVKIDVAESNFQSYSVSQASTSAPAFDPRFPEYRYGVICCILNTEDTEIPCNDDIVFPSKKPAHGHKRTKNKAAGASSSGMGNTSTQVKGRVAEIDSQRNETLGGSRIPSSRYGGLCQNSTAIKNEHPDLPVCDVAHRSGQLAELNHLQKNVGVMTQEAQHMHSSSDFADPMVDEVDEVLVSSEEEKFFDSDADIPSFSDVEAMILDADLNPADQDSFCAAAVAKLLQEDAMKAIIRLEQSAHSYMRRDMASHGAFAVLFGRRSKHYIKKPEVLLGRATDGVKVDIDLTREGHANKISRRQATIKMDGNGTFSLKNLGRCPIYVNSEEISPGQHLDLDPNCLIEIRGMPFLFEVNQQRVKLYLENAVR
ncbi:hypothetical protein vseg_004676 [Gypsophila vaccaria]